MHSRTAFVGREPGRITTAAGAAFAAAAALCVALGRPFDSGGRPGTGLRRLTRGLFGCGRAIGRHRGRRGAAATPPPRGPLNGIAPGIHLGPILHHGPVGKEPGLVGRAQTREANIGGRVIQGSGHELHMIEDGNHVATKPA